MFAPLRPLAACVMMAALALPALAPPARADQTDKIIFDVSLQGIPAGRLSIEGKIAGTGYAASGVMETTGLAGALKKIRYAGSVSGAYAGARFTPQVFQISSRRGDEASSQSIRYKAGTPASVSREPPRAPRASDVNPAKQGGTIDPLTALYAVLRDVAPEEACTLKVTMYDGSKRSQVALSTPQAKGEKIICTGEYRRLAGFTEKEMAHKSRFPFTLTYAPTEAGRLRVVEISTDTILGKGRLKRR